MPKNGGLYRPCMKPEGHCETVARLRKRGIIGERMRVSIVRMRGFQSTVNSEWLCRNKIFRHIKPSIINSTPFLFLIRLY